MLPRENRETIDVNYDDDENYSDWNEWNEEGHVEDSYRAIENMTNLSI